MEIQNQVSDEQHRLALSVSEEAAIQAIAQRIGLRISQEIVAALSDMLILMSQAQKAPTTLPEAIAPPDMPPIMTVGDAAKLLRLSRAKVYQLIQRKEMRSVMIDRSVRVWREDLDDFVKQHRGSGSSSLANY
jgi:excisionase family DNA binding protein